MSQRGVEVVLGRLVTDTALRARFAQSARHTLRALIAEGIELSRIECSSLERLESAALDRFAEALDPRIQKACAPTGTER